MKFVDSNVFIYHLAGDPLHGDRATEILKSIEAGEATTTSTLIIAQVCGYLKWKKRESTIPIFLNLLRGLTSLKKVETEFMDFMETIEEQKRLEAPWKIWDDLVIATQMKRLGMFEIYSNDLDFDKIPQVKRIF